jgi:hypothetical protein
MRCSVMQCCAEGCGAMQCDGAVIQNGTRIHACGSE